MSMTKRHLESLPSAEQDAILGPIDHGDEAMMTLTEQYALAAAKALPAKCERCGDSLPANWRGVLCEYCQMSRDRRRKCDIHYGWH